MPGEDEPLHAYVEVVTTTKSINFENKTFGRMNN